MNRRYIISNLVGLLFLLLTAMPLFAFDVGFEGTEDLIVSESTTLQLPPDGILKYRNVHVQSGATLTFAKNENNTPVQLLASGDVTIDGTVSVNASGKSGGPGGYDGGGGGPKIRTGRRGEGPGGADGGKLTTGSYGNTGGHGGGYGTDGGLYINTSYGQPGKKYGNSRLVPIMGGSGGGGGGGSSSGPGGIGGGGGGAILIAAVGVIAVNGNVVANGAGGGQSSVYSAPWNPPTSANCYSGGGGGGGTGGGIRLIATQIKGAGSILANGGGGGKSVFGFHSSWYSANSCSANTSGSGAIGRILLEGDTISQNISSTPQAAFGPPVALYPADVPSLNIVSVSGVAVPTTAKGAMESPDVWLPYNTSNPVPITVQATNVPAGATITIKAQPVEGSVTSATSILSGNSVTLNATLSTQFPSVITAFATYELTTAMTPIFAGGEQVASVRVETMLGGGSKVVYITESGREVLAKI